MSDELKVKIQWLPDLILTVVTHSSSTAEELASLLQFACFKHEKIYLFYKGCILNPAETLKSQGIGKGDVIECKIVNRFNRFNEIFSKKDQSIVREMARVLDMKTNIKVSRKEIRKSGSKSYSDSDSPKLFAKEKSDLTTSNDISSEPLPIIWQNNDYEKILIGTESNLQSNGNHENTNTRNECESVLHGE